jgi:hypothetical protein
MCTRFHRVTELWSNIKRVKQQNMWRKGLQVCTPYATEPSANSSSREGKAEIFTTRTCEEGCPNVWPAEVSCWNPVNRNRGTLWACLWTKTLLGAWVPGASSSGSQCRTCPHQRILLGLSKQKGVTLQWYIFEWRPSLESICPLAGQWRPVKQIQWQGKTHWDLAATHIGPRNMAQCRLRSCWAGSKEIAGRTTNSELHFQPYQRPPLGRTSGHNPVLVYNYSL